LKVIFVRPASIHGTNRPDHHEDKEAIEPLAFIEPANVLVICLLTDHGLDELRPVHSRKVENNGTADYDADVVVDGPNDVAVDENTCYRCQGARNNRDHCLKDRGGPKIPACKIKADKVSLD